MANYDFPPVVAKRVPAGWYLVKVIRGITEMSRGGYEVWRLISQILDAKTEEGKQVIGKLVEVVLVFDNPKTRWLVDKAMPVLYPREAAERKPLRNITADQQEDKVFWVEFDDYTGYDGTDESRARNFKTARPEEMGEPPRRKEKETPEPYEEDDEDAFNF